MPTRLVWFLILVHLFAPVVPLRATALRGVDGPELQLTSQVKNYTLNADNLADALAKVAAQFQIPMGIEWTEDAETMRKLSLSWTRADLQQVIQEVVSAYRGYQFDVSDGVVHVFPEWTRTSQQDFVKLKIQTFLVRSQVPEVASHHLRALVKLTVSPPPQTSATGGGTGGSQFGSASDKEINLRLEDTTVRNALDQLALISDRKVWIVTFTDDALLTPTGFRRTRTLWNNEAVSDSEQPVWDAFRWGDAVPPRKE